MKRILGIVVLAFIFVSISISGVSAEHYSTRAFGMGGAYTGIADDVSSIIYNR